MRALALAALLVPITAATATAGPREVTVGVSTGWTRASDAPDGTDATRTWGLWGRLRLTPRLAGQLELVRHETQLGCDTCTIGTSTEVRTLSALVVVDLADRGRWMPVLVAGYGLDRDDGTFQSRGHHTEGGFGVEYRADGFVAGADVRLGGRSVDAQDVVLAGTAPVDGVATTALAPGGLQAGEYHALRVTLGVRF